MKTTVIFDLDGTLLNTIEDIADATNAVLEKHQLPTHDIESYKYFVGNGIYVLARKAIPESIQGDEFEKLATEVIESYKIVQNTKTRPYDGILDLLHSLNEKSINVAVLSNKPHDLVKPTMDAYFSGIEFCKLLGSRNDVPKKPAPDGVFEILDELKESPANCLFVGDTSTDIKTGVASGVDAVGILWGFRGEDELKAAGASYLVKDPLEILELLEK
jgi:phosphoglycolate phosphatase